MSGSFYGLEISKTGLFASRSAMNTTGHNISNANTEGYTRQRVSLESIEPYYANERFLSNCEGEVGGGVDTAQIEQIRNSYLDIEIRRENADMGFWSTVSSEMEYVETVMNEMSDTSISQSLADFYSSLNNLSQNPESSEMRTIVQQEGIKLTQTINHTYDQLVEIQNVMNDSLSVTAGDINAHIENIAIYNEKIVAYELGGQNANDLRDKRNLLLDELSELVDIEYEEDADGNTLVSVLRSDGTKQEMITADAPPDDVHKISIDENANNGFYDLKFGTPATTFEYSSGELEGYRQMRDSDASDSIGIPKIMEELNTLANDLADAFNTQHSAGYNLYVDSDPTDNDSEGTTGIDFFDKGTVAARDIKLTSNPGDVDGDGNDDGVDGILDDINLIAASSNPITSSNIGNNENALAMLKLTTEKRAALNNATFEDYIESMVVNIAIDAGYSDNMNDAQEIVIRNIEDRRQSVSGVSLDEEMSNLIKYQNSYAASSRMITAVDEALDILINSTGLVGR